MYIKNKINSHLYKIYNNLDDTAEVFEFDPLKLIWDSRRFDHATKWVYLNEKHKYPHLSWWKTIYYEHIKAFSSGKFTEGDGNKKNFNDFIRDFEQLEASFKKNDFNTDETLIPFVNEINVDGSHRISLAAFYKKALKGVVLKQLKEPNYNFSFFQNKKQPQWINDFVYFQRVLSNNKIRIVHVHPTSIIKDNEIATIFNAHKVKVEYHKEIRLKRFAHGLIVREFYKHEKWIGNHENKFQGALGHSSKSYSSKKPLKIFFIEEDNLNTLRSIKTEIRKKCGIGNFSVHINDSYQETLDLANIFLNEQSIKFINSCFNNSTFWKTDQFLNDFIKNGKLTNIGDYAVVGSFPLALIGLRENRDIDIVCNEDEYKEHKENLADIDCHNKYLQQFGLYYEDILSDPRQHFYWQGQKFLSLENVWKIKEQRREKKDYIDKILFHTLQYSSLNTNWLFQKINRFKLKINPRPIVRKLVGEKFYQKLKEVLKNG